MFNKKLYMLLFYNKPNLKPKKMSQKTFPQYIIKIPKKLPRGCQKLNPLIIYKKLKFNILL